MLFFCFAGMLQADILPRQGRAGRGGCCGGAQLSFPRAT